MSPVPLPSSDIAELERADAERRERLAQRAEEHLANLFDGLADCEESDDYEEAARLYLLANPPTVTAHRTCPRCGEDRVLVVDGGPGVCCGCEWTGMYPARPPVPRRVALALVVVASVLGFAAGVAMGCIGRGW